MNCLDAQLVSPMVPKITPTQQLGPHQSPTVVPNHSEGSSPDPKTKQQILHGPSSKGFWSGKQTHVPDPTSDLRPSHPPPPSEKSLPPPTL